MLKINAIATRLTAAVVVAATLLIAMHLEGWPQ